ncbi:MAG TPA: hypothetical protein VH157_06920 [Bryobacteraceae bacterium]|jgi:hypothetical protein|nr:hypothetical protein [Bryobacteraceae bacterium]
MAAGAFPTFDVVEIAQEAAERAGIEFRSGYSLRTARRALELLQIEWANRGLNLWTIEGPVTITLLPGISQYWLPDDTVDLVDHILRIPTVDANGVSQYTDFPLDRMTFPEYDAIPNKWAQGRPSIVSIRRQIHPYFYLWMTPPTSPVYALAYYRLRRMAPLGQGGTGMPEIPWRFIPAMIAGLAFRLALKSKDPNALQRVPLLKAEYEEQFGLASDEDRDRASFHFIPWNYQSI